MKIVSLKMHNVFRFGEENNEIVFDDFFNEDSVALICGMTDGNIYESNGTGKSTIFDCIAYALFEKVPRLHVHGAGTGYAVNEIIRTEDDGTIKCEDSYVSLTVLDDSGDKWVIKRGRKMNKAMTKSSAIFELYCEDESKSAQTKSKPQEKIDSIVGVSYEAFINSTMLVQRDVGKFLTGTNKARKEILLDLLAMNEIDVLLARARKLKKVTLDSLTALEGKRELVQGRIEEVDVDSLRKDITLLRKEIEDTDVEISKVNDKIKSADDVVKKCLDDKANLATDIKEKEMQLKAAMDDFNSKKQVFESDMKTKSVALFNLTRQRDSLANLISDYSREIKDADEGMLQVDKEAVEALNQKVKDAENEKPALDARKNDLTSIQMTLTSEKGQINGKLAVYDEEIKKFKNLLGNSADGKVKCPSCGVSTDDSHFNSHLDKITEHRDVVKKDLDNILLKLQNITEEIDVVSTLIMENQRTINRKHEVSASVTRYKSLKDQKAKSEVKKAEKELELSDVRTKINEAQGESEKSIEILNSFSLEKDKIGVDIKKDLELKGQKYQQFEVALRNANASENDLRSSLIVLQSRKSEKAIWIATLDYKIQNAEREKATLAQIKKDIATDDIVKKRLLYFEDILGLNGVKKDIVKTIIPDLNDLINEYLSDLKNGMTVDLVENDKELDIIIRGASASSYHLLSGGEKEAIRIATDIALGMSALGINGKLSNMLFLDEIFGALDDGTKSGVLNLLKKLSDQFERILVITHDSDLKEKFKNKIWVEKRNGLSTIVNKQGK